MQEGENGEVRVGSVGIGGNEVHHEGPLEAQHHHEELLRPQHRYLPILSGIVCPFSVLLEVSTRDDLHGAGLERRDTDAEFASQVPGLTERVRCGSPKQDALSCPS